MFYHFITLLFFKQVLFKWLRLPQLDDDGDSKESKRARNQFGLLNHRRKTGSNCLPKATNVLLHRLAGLHPLPNILLEWRHLHGILEKHLNSFVQVCRLIDCDQLKVN